MIKYCRNSITGLVKMDIYKCLLVDLLISTTYGARTIATWNFNLSSPAPDQRESFTYVRINCPFKRLWMKENIAYNRNKYIPIYNKKRVFQHYKRNKIDRVLLVDLEL